MNASNYPPGVTGSEPEVAGQPEPAMSYVEAIDLAIRQLESIVRVTDGSEPINRQSHDAAERLEELRAELVANEQRAMDAHDEPEPPKELTKESRRELLREEMRVLEGSRGYETDRGKQRRVREIARILLECICRECGKRYQEDKARGDLKGFCSAKCQHACSRNQGFRPGQRRGRMVRSEYDVLKSAKQVGSVYVCK